MKNTTFLRQISIYALLAAGVGHLVLAFEHMTHTPAHGFFFIGLGLVQIVWGLVSWFRPRTRQHPLHFWSGVMLSGGVIILWILTQILATPFMAEPEPVDIGTLLTLGMELVAFVALVLVAELRPTITNRRWYTPSYISALVFSLGIGGLVWAGGMGIVPLFPQWAHDHATHDHGGELVTTPHLHSAPTALTVNASAYLTLVNAGREVDTLIGVSSSEVETVSLHRTVVENEIARMESVDGVELKPHTRVEFAPNGSHIMLESLTRDLYEGETLTLTLHFASGRQVEVPFEVYMLPPEGRFNFIAADDVQVTNAWIRATASANGAMAAAEGSYAWDLPPGFPLPNVPVNNPMTAEKVELGRHLFYDFRLSGNKSISCSSCHLQELAFSDGAPRSLGSTGEVHPRNSMSLTNSAYSATLTWANPNLLTLEQQIAIPMFGEHPVEMGITGNEAEVLERFRQDELYQSLFAAAYPEQGDPITFNNITLALASFTRTLISGNSPYDRYLQGDETALSESAQRGMALFFSEGLECHHCHTGFNFSLSTASANSTFAERPFFNTGLYNVGGTGAYPANSPGVIEITNKLEDTGRFRPPTLRNIELTAPYMHDGSMATLEAVVQFYTDGGRNIIEGEHVGDGRANPYKSGLVPGFTLTDQEQTDLVEFLKSLTDEAFITDPRFSDPFVQQTASTGG